MNEQNDNGKVNIISNNSHLRTKFINSQPLETVLGFTPAVSSLF